MYHKNKSLCFYVSQVSLKSFLGSEREGGSTGYAVVEGALAQYLVVSDFLVHLTEGDVSVTPKRSDKIKQFYNMFIEIPQRWLSCFRSLCYFVKKCLSGKIYFPNWKVPKSQLDDFWLLTGEAWAVRGTGLNLPSNSEWLWWLKCVNF